MIYAPAWLIFEKKANRKEGLIPLMPGLLHLVGRCLWGDAGLSLLGHVSERMQAGGRRSAIFGNWDQAR